MMHAPISTHAAKRRNALGNAWVATVGEAI